MTVSTLRPNATDFSAAIAVTGAASAHAALADNSDTSYITFTDDDDSTLRVGLQDLGLPAGAALVIARARVRVARSSAGVANCPVAILTDDEEVTAARVFLNWLTPTTVTVSVTWSPPSDAAVDAAGLGIGNTETLSLSGFEAIRVYEAYLDVTYVAKPTTTPSAPSGTITTTNTPTVAWTNGLDSDGGGQTAYEVKIFPDSSYLAGGFDPATAEPLETSGIVASPGFGWPAVLALPNDVYRAYVRVAQTVNGGPHWSDWDYAEFTIDVDKPGVPLLEVTDESEDGRLRIEITHQAGPATTDALEIQRSTDHLTWEPLRLTTDTAGVIAGLDSTVYDLEAGNGETVYYRARALHNYDGLYAASDWAEADGAWLDSHQWWLKSVQHPSLNTPVTVDSLPSYQRPSRDGRFQALGARNAIVVSDTRGADQGTIVLRVDTDLEASAIDDLLDYGGILLLQGSPSDKGWRDRYVKLGDLDRPRLVDKGFVEGTRDSMPWIEVDAPTGPIDLWPEDGS
jgi:hypothetical protein